MNKKDAARLSAIAQELGLGFDERAQAVYGCYKGYHMVLKQGAQRGIFTILTAASVSGQPIDRDMLKPHVKASKAVAGAMPNRYTVTFTVKPASFSIGKVFARIPEAFEDAARMLNEIGASCCCQDTGAFNDLGVYMCGAAPAILCADAYAARSNMAVQSQQSEFLKKESFIGGLVGAFLGSLIGMASIVLIGQMGYVAAISGFIMGICTLKGYELLGGKLSKKGVIAGIILMILMVYVGNRMDWALSISSQLEAEGINGFGMFECFRYIGYWLEMDMIDAGAYYANLVMIYLFVILGSFTPIKNGLSSNNAAVGVYPLGGKPAAYAYTGSGDEDYQDEPVDGDLM